MIVPWTQAIIQTVFLITTTNAIIIFVRWPSDIDWKAYCFKLFLIIFRLLKVNVTVFDVGEWDNIAVIIWYRNGKKEYFLASSRFIFNWILLKYSLYEWYLVLLAYHTYFSKFTFYLLANSVNLTHICILDGFEPWIFGCKFMP